MTVTYDFGSFELVHDTVTGYTATVYSDGMTSGCGVVEGDEHHAPLLGITPQRHRLAHELLHHLCARWRQYDGYDRGCRIVWRDAHGIPQVDDEAMLDEWVITAMTYYAYNRVPADWGALMDLGKEAVDVAALARHVRWLLAAADQPGKLLTVRLA